MTPDTVYRRPYKSRTRRREADKRKVEDVRDHRFLIRLAAGVAIVVVVALVFAMKGMNG